MGRTFRVPTAHWRRILPGHGPSGPGRPSKHAAARATARDPGLPSLLLEARPEAGLADVFTLQREAAETSTPADERRDRASHSAGSWSSGSATPVCFFRCALTASALFAASL